ncbi:MAG TPA: hypothetical protein VG755_40365 [Nannocystaceae bacterium]|nr:hypothetical protein [Nannocystaceae bacterium]
MFAWVLGCGPTTSVGDSSESGGGSTGHDGSTTTLGTSVGTTVGEATGTSTTLTTSVDSSGTTDACATDLDSDTFGGDFDVGPSEPTCDLFEQNCDKGEKCVPVFGFSTRDCVPIAPEPLADGESCEAGSDDPCGPSSWCGLPDDDGNGTCLPLCTGAFANPICPVDTICVIDDEMIVAYCAAPCDPFDPAACPGHHSCQPTARGFGCLEEGGHTRGEHCLQNDSCADGLYCAPGGLVEGCCFESCCAPLCSDANPCEGGACQPLGDAVPGPDGLGFCG